MWWHDGHKGNYLQCLCNKRYLSFHLKPSFFFRCVPCVIIWWKLWDTIMDKTTCTSGSLVLSSWVLKIGFICFNTWGLVILGIIRIINEIFGGSFDLLVWWRPIKTDVGDSTSDRIVSNRCSVKVDEWSNPVPEDMWWVFENWMCWVTLHTGIVTEDNQMGKSTENRNCFVNHYL